MQLRDMESWDEVRGWFEHFSNDFIEETGDYGYGGEWFPRKELNAEALASEVQAERARVYALGVAAGLLGDIKNPFTEGEK